MAISLTNNAISESLANKLSLLKPYWNRGSSFLVTVDFVEPNHEVWASVSLRHQLKILSVHGDESETPEVISCLLNSLLEISELELATKINKLAFKKISNESFTSQEILVDAKLLKSNKSLAIELFLFAMIRNIDLHFVKESQKLVEAWRHLEEVKQLGPGLGQQIRAPMRSLYETELATASY